MILPNVERYVKGKNDTDELEIGMKVFCWTLLVPAAGISAIGSMAFRAWMIVKGFNAIIVPAEKVPPLSIGIVITAMLLFSMFRAYRTSHITENTTLSGTFQFIFGTWTMNLINWGCLAFVIHYFK